MASLTIRKLDEAIRVYLRLRSAKNCRSAEEELRVILGEIVQGRSFEFATAPSQTPPPHAEAPARFPGRAGAVDQARVTLIICGGIAAYKSLELIRPLQ